MTLPDSAAYGTVTGQFYRGSAGVVEADVPTELRVRFRPGLQAGVVRSNTAGAIFAVDEVTATVDSSGQLLGADGAAGVRLLASVSPDLTPSGWTWTVAISSRTLAAVTFAFVLEVAQTIDLATVLQVPANPGETVDAWLQAASIAQAARDEALAAAASVEAGSAAAIQAAIAALVGAAPEALDTLQEIDATIAADEGSAAALAALVGTKAPRDSPTFTGTVAGITPGMVGADPAGAAAAAQAASLQKNANLADLASPSAARTSLGLGTAATHPATDFDVAGAAAAAAGAVTKSSLGLGNVDNTADTAKPVSAAQAAALALKADAASVAATSATLWKPSTAYAAGQAVVNPSGFVVTALTGFTSGASYNAANWSDPVAAGYSPLVGPKIPALEGVPAFICGDSYGSGGSSTNSDVGWTYLDRFCARHRTQTATNVSVAGTRSDQILMTQVIPNWTPNRRGLVGIADVVLNDVNLYPDNTSTPTTAAAFRAMLTYLTAAYIASATDTGILFGPNWTTGASSTVGSYADVSFTGDAVSILTTAVTSAGGTVTVTDTAGTVRATITTGGYAQTFTQATKIAGFGSGAHTVRLTLTAGSATIVGAALPSSAAPTVVWVKPGDRNLGTAARIAAYLAACATVATDFPTVVPIDMDTSYSPSTMLGSANHPNDYGNSYIANLIEKALLPLAFRQGLNELTLSTQGAVYTPTSPTYTSPGATAPAAPTGVTATTGNQMSVSWTRSADGGATITSQLVQTSPTGANTWTTQATPAPSATSYTITGGLAGGSGYDVRVAAVNSVGTGAYGTAANTVAGTAVTTYSADTFTRADSASLGSTETGAFAWSTFAASQYTIASNTLKGVGSSNPPVDATINDGHNDGTWQVDLSSTGYGGIAFCIAADHTTGYVWYRDGSGNLFLKKRTAGNTYTTIFTGTAATTAITLKVVKSGSTINGYVNGSLITTQTDATYTGPLSGVWAGSTATPAFDNWLHTS